MAIEYDGVLLRCEELDQWSTQIRDQAVIQLIENVKSALTDQSISFENIQSVCQKVYIETNDVVEVAKTASQVFGVSSMSPVSIIPKDELSLSDSHDKTHFEECDDKVFRSTERLDGIGGLPTGFQGRAVCTISGGLDSPVAAFKIMKRGCIPIFVHFDNFPFGDESTRNLAIRQARKLTEYIHGHEIKMYIVPHGEDLTEVLRHAPRKMTCVFCRRNMYRLAQEIARIEDADAIVTGEIIGEQASQTTRNLLAEESAVDDIPIIRPCIGDDKVEIEKMARKIDTYKFAHEAVSCCSLPPKYPTVYADIKKIKSAESKMDMGWIATEMAQAEVIIMQAGVKDH